MATVLLVGSSTALLEGLAQPFQEALDRSDSLPPEVQRAVLAELTLPLERNRLLALAQRVRERSRDTGKAQRDDHPRESSK